MFGFEVWVDASWLLLAALLIWTLGKGIFPEAAPNLAPASYWWMAVIATVGLLVSIVMHEMAHSLVARRYGMPIRGITLFIFGGVAEMEGEPGSARGEFLMAAAGPLASFALATVLALVLEVLPGKSGSEAVPTVVWYLALMNGTLALFNLVPAFPLDGGRMLRAALWAWRGDFAQATRIAVRAGDLFGIFLIVVGVFDVIRGDFVGGMWQFLIGLFLRGAAAAGYRESMVRRVLAGIPVQRLMTANPTVVSREISVADFIEDYVYRYHHRVFPVVEAGRLIGTVGTEQAAALERGRWSTTPVGTIMVACGPTDVIAPEAEATVALERMRRAGKARLHVVSDDRLVGILSLRDLLELLDLKLQLEGTDAGAVAHQH
ncbi:MAG TPA: site-2 protease family protein [Stellaceae bacterium]|nr:site-2 protease family protein [Stellaceae bacterium]